MKKKIIGIILTAAMVLTLLPVFALPAKAEKNLVVKKDGKIITEGTDFKWLEGKDIDTLVIKSSGLALSGTIGNPIRLEENVDSITLDGLSIIPTSDLDYGIYTANANGTVTITLKNDNQIGNYLRQDPENPDGKNFIIDTGIDGLNLDFKGDGSLTIYGQKRAITAGIDGRDGKTFDITFTDSFSGELTVKQWGGCDVPMALLATGKINFYGGKFSIISNAGLGIAGWNGINIGEGIEQIVSYGNLPVSVEQIAGSMIWVENEKNINVSPKLLMFGKAKVDADFKESEIDESVEITKLEDVGGDTPYFTYITKNGLAKAILIKHKDEPKNPETEDTSAMLIWAFAGLAALAVAAGILVFRKQRD